MISLPMRVFSETVIAIADAVMSISMDSVDQLQLLNFRDHFSIQPDPEEAIKHL
jgi:hypothetical protein